MFSTGKQPEYIRHTYKLSNELKSYSVYQITAVDDNKNLLTDVLRIEKFQGKSNATNIKDYLRLRTATNWQKCQMITGLRPTQRRVLFYGDRKKVNESNEMDELKELLIFVFSENREILIIDVYRGFYPYNKGILQNILNRYEKHLKQ
ncbi:hypothetical protein [Flavobacterium sp.]|uniref:hypothetical protein n=1 Tax=Flavobacterium sp. TaxID=239 RepID=UPI003B9CBB27